MGTADPIVMLTNHDDRFYPLIGPYLARRHIVAETGAPLWDDDAKLWFAALTDTGHVAGLCAALPYATHTRLQSAYVAPGHRRQGIYRRLWRERQRHTCGPYRATCTAASLPMFLAHGYTIHRTRGSFTEVRHD